MKKIKSVAYSLYIGESTNEVSFKAWTISSELAGLNNTALPSDHIFPREDGPSIIDYHGKRVYWHRFGMLDHFREIHRTDGPARIQKYGEQHWENGSIISERCWR